MKVRMFSSWQVRCGIADYSARFMQAVNALPDTSVEIVPFDRQPHTQQEYRAWGSQLNQADIAHIQFDYSFFDYLFPWRQKFTSLTQGIKKPLVVTRHVSFDGPLKVYEKGAEAAIHQAKWQIYQHPLNPYATFLNKTIFERADHIIVLTGRLKEHLLKRGLPEEKISVIPAGVKAMPVISAADGISVRQKLGWQDKRIIGQFGFIAPPKGHMLMLDALAQLPDDFVWLIAGGVRVPSHQAYLDELNAQMVRRGLQSRVHVTGFVEECDLPAYIAACDVMVSPNTHADFSQSVADALAFAWCPVIASDIYGHREIAVYCPALQLFKAGDSSDLVEAIQSAVSTNNLNDLQATMRIYREDYSWRAIAIRTREVYEKILTQTA